MGFADYWNEAKEICAIEDMQMLDMTAVADSSSPWNQVDNADPFEAGFTSLKAHNIDKHA